MSDVALQAWVEAVRADLETEFRPRGARALDRWPVTCSRTVYGDVDCQIIAPQAANGVHLLYFFGGGYVSGVPEYDLPITAALAHLTGLTIIAPRYALAPEHPFPTSFEQGRAILCDLESQNIPLIGLSGESAGAGLAMAVARDSIAEKGPKVHSLTLFSPWIDLTPTGRDACAKQDDPTLDASDLSKFAHAFLQGHDPDDPRASPACATLPANWPSTYLSTGGRDCLRPNVLALHNKLHGVGANVTTFDAPDMWHVFELYDETDAAMISLNKAADHLNARLANWGKST